MFKLPKFLQINENDSEEEKKKKKFLLILFPVVSILVVVGIILAILFGVRGCSTTHEHVWGEATYTWASDYSSCIAIRVCKDDESHKETETKDSVYAVTKEAKCEEDGSGRYTVTFENEAFEVQTHEITLPATGHDLTAHDSHAETCTEAGNNAYWSCEICGKFYSDAEGTNEIENNSWIIPAHHTLIHHEANAETCTEAGNNAYWSCEICGKFYSDAEGTNEIENNSWIISAHHTLIHHEAKAATRLKEGNIEYWSCEICGKFYSDAEGTNEIDAQSVIIPALGTDKSYFVGTKWNGNGLTYCLYLNQYKAYYDSSKKINYCYDDFDYDDDTKELSFTISRIDNYNIYTPKYNVGDVLTFIYNAEDDVLTFDGIRFVKSYN